MLMNVSTIFVFGFAFGVACGMLLSKVCFDDEDALFDNEKEK